MADYNYNNNNTNASQSQFRSSSNANNNNTTSGLGSRSNSRHQSYRTSSATNNNNNNVSMGTYNNNDQQQQQQQQQYNQQEYNPQQMNQGQEGEQQPTRAAPAPSPFSQPLRWVLLVLLVLGVGAGITGHVITSALGDHDNIMMTRIGTTHLGIWRSCDASGTTCTDIFPDISNSCAADVMSTKNRFIIVVSFLTAGLGFAFIAWPFVFILSEGLAGHIIRHILLFLSVGLWAAGLSLFHWSDFFLDCSGVIAGAPRGISFWLCVASGGTSFIGFILSIVIHIMSPSSAPSPAVAQGGENNNNNTIENNNNNNFYPSAAAASAGTQQQQDQKQQPEGSNYYPPPQQDDQQNQSTNKLNDTTYSHANASYNNQDGSSMITADGGAADGGDLDARDPASVGLGADWYFDDESGYWWSDEAQLYYDADSRSYGNPTDGTWYNAETGEWA